MTRIRYGRTFFRSLPLGAAALSLAVTAVSGRSALATTTEHKTAPPAALVALVNSMPPEFRKHSVLAQALEASRYGSPSVPLTEAAPVNMGIVEHSLPVGTVPIDIKNGPDGAPWFSYARGMGRIDPVTKRINLYPSPIADGVPYAVNGGPGPYMYFTALGVTTGVGNGIGRINVKTHAYQFFTIPTVAAYPADIKTGPDGNEWFSETLGGKIGVFNTRTLTIKEFVTGLATLPQDVATGQGSCEVFEKCPPGIATPGGPLGDGNVWYTLMGVVPGLPYSKLPVGLPLSLGAGRTLTQPNRSQLNLGPGNALLSINPRTYKITEYPYPTALSGTLDVDPGPNNYQVWFAEITGNKIGYIDLRTHIIKEIPLSVGATPFTIGAGPKVFPPEMYFTEEGANAIGTYDPATGKLGQLPVPTPGAVFIDLTQNSISNTMFFTEAAGNKIGEVVISKPK